MEVGCLLKIEALFSDYDGVLSPADTLRETSQIPQGVEEKLRKIAGLLPFAIITSKDFDFVFPRAGFAKAWACICGLDVRLADGTAVIKRGMGGIEWILDVRRVRSFRGLLETKRDSFGRLLGLSVDWRNRKGPPEHAIEGILRLGREKKLFVSYNKAYPFIDIFAEPVDKGKSLRALKRLLRVRGKVMYIGDSPLDNAAFEQADVSVGISHGQPLDELKCKYILDYSELEGFLSSLVERDLDFSPAMPYVRENRLAQSPIR